ncbi:MAG: DUF4091 domain-containing protein [Chloroflexaceae bacterium]|nr:DUF4091 domain-containing protein [Chloroflexaceae bacterium]
MPTISNYQVERAHDRQVHHGEEVWWYFLYGDRPPLPNPTVIDRTGIEARITPWLAWLERVEGLVYYSTTGSWDDDPWMNPWTDNGNGDGLLFYPPVDDTVAFDACNAQSNRLVPSIRWELLREGMEDYAYLWLLNGGDPVIGEVHAADTLAGQFIASRTRFSRVPTDLYATRAAIAAELVGPGEPSAPTASKSAQTSSAAVGETFVYELVYHAGDTAHTVTINDTLPANLELVTASGSRTPAPEVDGQFIRWTVALTSSETVTLTLQVRADTAGLVENTATFAGLEQLSGSAGVVVYTNRVYLPLVRSER